MGVALFVPIIYSTVAHSHLSTLETIGFDMMMNTSLPNHIVTGVVSKYYNSSIYAYAKYQNSIS
jgi:hypothetical protein